MTMSEWPSQIRPGDCHAVDRQFQRAGKRTDLELEKLMAFGFGFNKQKVLSAAEKFVQQGKLQNAISEYEKVLKADSKDLTVLNTIGDLYSRSGEQEKAVESFKNVVEDYASQGFDSNGNWMVGMEFYRVCLRWTRKIGMA